MRTLNTIKNMASGFGVMIVSIILGFITRKVFVDSIGVEYLGLNGLLQNILGVMTLIESGFATSVIFNLYKPIANNDQPRIIALLQLYRKVYRYMALGVFLCALAIYPFLNHLIKDAQNLEYISVVYFIFLFNSLIQYFTAYKLAIINANQKNYKLTTINIIYQIGLSLGKISILYYTQSYILYLIIEACFGLGYNLAIVKKANKLFPYIVTKIKYEVEPDVKQNIKTNMKALFFHALGGYFMHSTDNIIISSFVGIAVVGLYSNYTLLTGLVKSFITQIMNSFSESVGNLIASESSVKIYSVFQTVFFINFIIVSIPIIILYNTLTPFIEWWLGAEYQLGHYILCIILFNFYVDNMRNSALTFKTKSGIFVQDRFTPLLQGIINLILSLIFVHYWGLFGVLLATSISILSIGFWQFPRLIYKHTFKQPLKRYFYRYTLYTSIAFVTLISSSMICQITPIANPLLKATGNATISILCIIIIYFCAFKHSPQYKSLLTYISNIYHSNK